MTLQAPETFGTFGAKYIYIYIFLYIYICIYLYTQQDARTYTFIYKETNRTAHMVTHKCALMFHKIRKKNNEKKQKTALLTQRTAKLNPPACYY